MTTHVLCQIRSPISVTVRCSCGWVREITRRQNALARAAKVEAAITEHRRHVAQPKGNSMTAFRDTDAASRFIASADSRETSPEIMHAIVFFARNLGEAEALWNGDGFGRICNPSDLWEHVTENGLRATTDYCWGAAGRDWWSAIASLDESAAR